MALGDVQLTALQSEAAPLDYVVPGSAIVRVKSVRALFTDNGAGGDWLPAVELISDSGHIIATASDQGSKVTAGGDAAGSFFPGVKHAAAAASTTQSWLRVVCDTATPAGAIPIDNGTVPTIGDFNTNDSARFVQTDASHWTMTRGVYTISGEVIASGGAVTVVNGDFVAGVRSGGGYAVNAFFGNASRGNETAFASLTIGDQSSLASWHGILTGSDTHLWSVHAYIAHVQGT